MITFLPHIMHACQIHGHVDGGNGTGCLSCESGLGGCTVCVQELIDRPHPWESVGAPRR